MGKLRISIFTIQDPNMHFLITSIMNILEKPKDLTLKPWSAYLKQRVDKIKIIKVGIY